MLVYQRVTSYLIGYHPCRLTGFESGRRAMDDFDDDDLDEDEEIDEAPVPRILQVLKMCTWTNNMVKYMLLIFIFY